MSQRGCQWIVGQRIEGEGQASIRKNPYDQAIAWEGNWASSSQIDQAMASACEAQRSWTLVAVQERIAIVKKFAASLESMRSELTMRIVQETGKPRWEADSEVSAAIGKVQNSIDAFLHRRSTVIEGGADPCSVIRYRPIGTMVVLGPFNLPAHLPGAHMVPAILAGNSVVFKPSELTPGVGECLLRAWHESGVPKGLVNLVHGAGQVAQQMVQDPRCDGVLFTGSYRVGKLLHQMLAGRPEVLLALELGGNNPLVIDRTQHVDAAVYQVLLSAYITSGQRCTCARRLIVIEGGQGDAVIDRLKKLLPKIAVGNPTADPQPFMGTVISSDAADKLYAFQEMLLSQGADSHVRMERKNEHGAMLTPGLIECGAQSVQDEEWFGPLLVVQRARDLDHAIELANQTRFGLSAGLISDEVDVYQHFVQRVRAGIVNWNRQTTGASGKLPFGGVGSSGNHRPSGSYAADYCSDPVASLESQRLTLPSQANPGLESIWQDLSPRS